MLNRFTSWIQSLSPVWLGVLGLVAVSLFVGGSLFAYRTYEYVEHDNDFCISCHLMAEPYEAFARSDHRELGCKACHKPSFAGRTQMALTQVLENPEEMSEHAHVPNEKCASCHIEGDPEKWQLIANSAGHKVHLESEEPELDGLQCVECHSTGVHEFAATDQTCAQAGCHEEIEVKLGRMGDLTIHCAACHSFAGVVGVDPDGEGEIRTAQEVLAPSQDDCMSCHAMRTLVEMPPDEPHEQVCSTCHNPHEQTTPAQASETCATVGCHNDASSLTPFHEGLEHTTVQDCMACHQAHDFSLDGNDCLSCHEDIWEDGPSGRVAWGVHTPAAPGGAVAAPAPALLIGVSPHPVGVPLEPAMSPVAGLHVVQEVQQDTVDTPSRPLISTGEVEFWHSQHRDVDCTSCHQSQEAHGQITLNSITDCRSCHHTAPEADACAECHTPAVLNPEPLVAQRWQMTFSTGEEDTRDVAFVHEDHADEDCTTCHQDGLQRPAQVASCNTCHAEHHEAAAEVTCISCHREPAEDAHDVESHLGCAGSGCHVDAPLQVTPRTRNGCLSCHQDLLDHEAPDECTDCHALPAPSGGSHP